MTVVFPSFGMKIVAILQAEQGSRARASKEIGDGGPLFFNENCNNFAGRVWETRLGFEKELAVAAPSFLRKVETMLPAESGSRARASIKK